MEPLMDIKDYLPRKYDLDITSLENLIEETKTMLRNSSELQEKPLAFHAVTWKESGHDLFTLYMPKYPGLDYERQDPSDDLFLSSLPPDYQEGFTFMGNFIDFNHFHRRAENLKSHALKEGRELGPMSFHLAPHMNMYRVYSIWYKS